MHTIDPRQGSPRSRDRLSRSFRMILVLIGICLMVCTIASFWAYRTYVSYRDGAIASDQTSVKLLSSLIEAHQQTVTSILQSYANGPLFVAAVKKRDVDAVARHLSMMKKTHDIDLTFVTDQKGMLWANFPFFQDALGADLSDRDWYKGVSSHWSPYISKVFRLIVADKPLASAIAVPVFDEDGEVTGILATSQRLSFLATIMRNIPQSPYMSLSVIDPEGRMIYSNKAPGYEMETEDYPFYSIVRQALQENRKQLQTFDHNKDREKRYISLAQVEKSSWTVVSERMEADILQSQYQRFAEVGISTLLLCTIILLSFLYFRKTLLLARTVQALNMESELRASESTRLEILNKLNEAQEVSNIGSWDWDLQNDKVWWSDELYRIFGVSPENYIPTVEANSKFIHPEDAQLFQNAFESGLRTGQQLTLDVRIILKNGTIKTCLAKGKTILNKDGQPIRYVGTVMDVTKHKETEEALRLSIERLRLAHEAAQAGTWEWDLSTNENFWSEELWQFYGLAPHSCEPSYETWRATIHPDDREKTEWTARESLRNGTSFMAEWRVIQADGKEHWLRATGGPLHDVQGRPLKYLGIVQDVTKQKQTEDALQKSQEEYQSLFDNMLNGFAYCKMLFAQDRPKDFVYLKVNKAFEALTGLKNVIGKKASEVIGDLERSDPRLLEAYGKVALTGTPEQFEIYLKAMQMWFSVSVFSPLKKHFVVVFDVITERKRAEALLRESEQRLALAASCARIGMFEWDVATGETFWNEQHAQLLGISATTTTTTTTVFTPYQYGDWALRVHPEDLHRIENKLHRCMSERVPYEAEYRVVWPDESIHWLTARGLFQYDAKGEPERMLGMAMDITERRTAEEELRRQASLLDLAYEPIFTWEPDGVISYWNRGAEQLYGYSKAQALGRSSHELLETVFGCSLDTFLANLKQDGAWHGELIHTRSDGTRVTVESRHQTFQDSAGRVLVLETNHDITARKEAEEEIRRQSEQLHALAGRLAEVEEIERQRMARELHDQIGQNLSALGVNLTLLQVMVTEGAKQERLLGCLGDSGMLLEQTIAVVRNLMVDLRPPGLDEYGLLEALRWYAANFSRRTGIQSDVVGDNTDQRLQPLQEISLFRIAQEALTNVLKHAQATRVAITLEDLKSLVRLIIADNGEGFEPTYESSGSIGGWGMMIMKERAMGAGGECRIESRVGGGTKIVVEVAR